MIKKNQRRLFFGLLSAIVVLAGGNYFFGKSDTQVTYREARVVRDTIELVILSTGAVKPQNRLELKPPVAGRMETVLLKEGESVKKGQIIAWMSSTERAALLDAARSAGVAEVKRWERDYKPTPVIAPIDGTMILRNVEPGQSFGSTDSLFTLSDRLTVKAQVDETDIGSIDVAQAAVIVLDAYPDREIPARVDHIAFDATTVNNVTTYIVDVLPDETPQFMKSGMTANVAFKIEKKEDTLVVPAAAIQNKGDQQGVQIRAPGSKEVTFKLITTGLTDGKKTEVKAGLDENDVVLIPEASKVAGPKGANPFSPFSGRRK